MQGFTGRQGLEERENSKEKGGGGKGKLDLTSQDSACVLSVPILLVSVSSHVTLAYQETASGVSQREGHDILML